MTGSGRRVRRGVAVVGVAVFALAFGRATSSADPDCGRYSAVASAAGMSTDLVSNGVLLSDVDGGLPATQATVDFLIGSSAWAGAPYSGPAAENAARATDPNDIPIFAVSSHPLTPEAGTSTPAATVQAQSGPMSSSATASGGAAPSEDASASHVLTTASAACTDEGVLVSSATSSVTGFEVAGVLSIGAVRSSASVVLGADGVPVTESSMDVTGASVAGVPVGFSADGVVVADPVAEAPENPVADALAGAGLSVRYLEAEGDPDTGDVLSAGLEIVIERGVGVGSGPTVTTITLGRAHAFAGSSTSTSTTPDTVPTVEPAPTPPSGGLPPAPVGSPSGPAVAAPPVLTGAVPSYPVTLGPTTGTPAAPIVASGPGDLRLTASLKNASNAGAYAMAAVGGLALFASWALLDLLGRRFRWR